MKKKSAEDYLDKLLNSVNSENDKKDKFKETAKMLEDAMTFWDSNVPDSDSDSNSDSDEYEYVQMAEITDNKSEKKDKKSRKKRKKSEHKDKKSEYKDHKSESEDVLDALLTNAKNMESDITKQRRDANEMYSRRVTKSEVDFLKEFEKELATEAGSYNDLFAEFDQELRTEDTLKSEDKPGTTDKQESKDKQEFTDKLELADSNAAESKDSFTLGDVDLAALVDEATDSVVQEPEDLAVEEPIAETPSIVEESSSEMQSALMNFGMASEPILMDEIPESMFDELFGEKGGLDFSDIPAEMPMDEESLDLGNLGDADLLSLLAGTEGLEDLGSMLGNGEITEISQDELDAFSLFAENEMSMQQPSDIVADGVPKEKKKGGFFDKVKGFFHVLLKEEGEVELSSGQAPTVDVLTSENVDIFAELDALEEMPSKKDQKKKEKKKKEKKKKEKKPKEPKAPKPKKEKKPKEVDTTPPLPRKPVIMIWLMAISMVAFVLIGVNLITYNTSVAEAKDLQNQGNYTQAYSKLGGLTIKEKDMLMYSQLTILSAVHSELKSYEVFAKAKVEDKAFDSLICAAGRCYVNEENATLFECLGQLDLLKKTVSNELHENYNMTYEEAIELYTIRYRDDYTIALYKKLTELGIEWE